MKKLMFAIGLGLMSGSVWASCMGPFCWDDRGAYVNGVVKDGNGDAHPSKTKAQIATSTPTVVGQVVYCSDCAAAGGAGTLCISTATTGGIGGGSYFVLSTGTVCK